LFDPAWHLTATGKHVKPPPVVTDYSAARSDTITARQRDVLGLVVGGYSDEQIAQRLSIQPETVRNHVSKMQRNAGTITRKDLIVWAMAQGIKAPAERQILPSSPPVQPSARCAWCQEALRPGNQFCTKCGRTISGSLKQWPVASRKCGYCNADIPAGDQFCRKCGRSLSGGLPNPATFIQPVSSSSLPFKDATKPPKKPMGLGAKIVVTLCILMFVLWILSFIVGVIYGLVNTQR